MTGKFLRRTARNVMFPNRPYFAHLALTHRCNLKCRFCHVTETPFEELDAKGMKRIIDRLDRAGVAVISISGGGEPLLRDDFDELIDYASARGLYVKLTSNGTMPRAKYERLLRSRVDEIGISLDGVRGHDLPFSHVGSPILSTLKFLNDQLPPGKHLTVNVTISESNRGEVDEILAFCASNYPKARVWLNPVVVGEGALRTSAPARSRPEYLATAKSPTLLKAPFYARGAERQFNADRFNWDCRAGDLFFDVKPNGDYWLCQDQPSPIPLNVLDPRFEAKRRAISKDERRECSGCIYSCYYVVQKGLEPRNWRDMGLLWWQANTEPEGPERRAAERWGPLGALACLLLRGAVARMVAMLFVALRLMAGEPAGSLRPEDVLIRMEAAGVKQREALRDWSNERVYRAGNTRLRRQAEARVHVEYVAPGTKSWRIVETRGSGLIVHRVIEPLLDAEQKGAAPSVRPASDIDRANYSFCYLYFDDELQAYVFEAVPHKPSRFQFRGRIAVDAESYGVRRVWGEPAVRPSFWVRRTEFVHDYGRFGGFWLPVRHRTKVELRIFGRSTLEIDYNDYRLNRRDSAAACVRGSQVALCLAP